MPLPCRGAHPARRVTGCDARLAIDDCFPKADIGASRGSDNGSPINCASLPDAGIVAMKVPRVDDKPPRPPRTKPAEVRLEELMAAAGKTIWLEDENLMDAVTAVSGSGPAVT